ncbi:MAG TPA: HAD family phosphatase [Terriglobales bacterium]|nr:HAD family phosphatase [Terriglobales bacterium]
MLKAVIFDIDGTLIDSVPLHARAWQEAFANFGKRISFDDVRSQIGKGGDQLIPVFLSKQEQQRFGEELDKFRGELWKAKYMSKVKPLPGARRLVWRVKEEGLQVALASSAKSDEIEFYKRVANIADLVQEQTSADDAERSKPHPDIFEAALARLKDVDAREAVTIGDSPYDAIAAGKLKMTSIGVLSGGFPEEELWKAGYSEIYRDCENLLQRYDSSLLTLKRAA